MTYAIKFSSEIDWKGFKKLPKDVRGSILHIIEEKLGSDPRRFGKPLRFSFRGYRRLRVGDYRVVYAIEKKTVRITAIGHRSKIY